LTSAAGGVSGLPAQMSLSDPVPDIREVLVFQTSNTVANS